LKRIFQKLARSPSSYSSLPNLCPFSCPNMHKPLYCPSFVFRVFGWQYFLWTPCQGKFQGREEEKGVKTVKLAVNQPWPNPFQNPFQNPFLTLSNPFQPPGPQPTNSQTARQSFGLLKNRNQGISTTAPNCPTHPTFPNNLWATHRALGITRRRSKRKNAKKNRR